MLQDICKDIYRIHQDWFNSTWIPISSLVEDKCSLGRWVFPNWHTGMWDYPCFHPFAIHPRRRVSEKRLAFGYAEHGMSDLSLASYYISSRSSPIPPIPPIPEATKYSTKYLLDHTFIYGVPTLGFSLFCIYHLSFSYIFSIQLRLRFWRYQSILIITSKTTNKMAKLTGQEVAEHNSRESCWVVVHVFFASLYGERQRLILV